MVDNVNELQTRVAAWHAEMQAVQSKLANAEAEMAEMQAERRRKYDNKLDAVAKVAIAFAAREDLPRTVVDFAEVERNEGNWDNTAEFLDDFGRRTVISVQAGCERKGVYSNGYEVENPNASYTDHQVVEVRLYVPRNAVADVIDATFRMN